MSPVDPFEQDVRAMLRRRASDIASDVHHPAMPELSVEKPSHQRWRSALLVGATAAVTLLIGLAIVLPHLGAGDSQIVIAGPPDAVASHPTTGAIEPQNAGAWDLSIPSADQFPPGVDLATTPVFFSGGPEVGNVVAAYFADRLGKSLSPEIAYTVEETGGDSALFRWEGTHSEHPSGHFGGWIYLRRESDAWGVIAVTTDGIDMSGLQRDDRKLTGVVSLESQRYSLFIGLVDENGEAIPELDLLPQMPLPTGSTPGFYDSPFIVLNRVVNSSHVVVRGFVFERAVSFGEVTLYGISEVLLPISKTLDDRRDRNVVVFIDTTADVDAVIAAIESLGLTSAIRELDQRSSQVIASIDAEGTNFGSQRVEITGSHLAVLVELKEGSTLFTIREAIDDVVGISGATLASISVNSSWVAPGPEWPQPSAGTVNAGPVVIPDVEPLVALGPKRMVLVGNSETVLVWEDGELREVMLGRPVAQMGILQGGFWMSDGRGLISLTPQVDDCLVPSERELQRYRVLDGVGVEMALVLRHLDDRLLYDCATGIETVIPPDEYDKYFSDFFVRTFVRPNGIFRTEAYAEGDTEIFFNGREITGDDSAGGVSISRDGKTIAYAAANGWAGHFTDKLVVRNARGDLLGSWVFDDLVGQSWAFADSVIVSTVPIEAYQGFPDFVRSYFIVDIDSGEVTPFAMPLELLFIN